MADGHPTREQLERFLSADLPRPESRHVLRHLLAGCTACREEAAGIFTFAADDDADEALLARLSPALDAAYDRAIDGAFRAVERRRGELERERAAAATLCTELEQHPPSRQQLLVRNSARFATPALCELLLVRSHEACFQDAERALELAELAKTVVERHQLREPSGEPESMIPGLTARCWGAVGNAQRLRGDYAAAERAFVASDAVLQESVLEPLDRARVLDWKASLRKDQRQFPEALRLLDRVTAIYQRLGQRHLLGKALAQKAAVCGESGDVPEAIVLLREALQHLDLEEEPRQVLVARHNLIHYLNQSGLHREAFALLFHTRPLYLEHGGRVGLLRLRWLEGSVASGLGRTAQAEVAFREAREGYLEQGRDYEAALVSLDLAMLYAGEGRTTDVRRLAEEMLPVFGSRQIHREALAALIVFRRAAEMEEAGMELVRSVADFLNRARNNPELRFA
ncbi:MAG TPA: tetratricopeptide repeat protein [Thermoanaerobaculia bacterium]|nr:tetratricopeptide repeat protein [Thermoanaerobaculia bacterium]